MNNKGKSLWLYAIVLFTIAFVLIFFSAINQFRMQKDFDTYKSKVEQSGVFEGVERGLSALAAENEDLRKKLKEAEAKVTSLENEQKQSAEKLQMKEQQISSMEEVLLNLLQAKDFFEKKKYKEGAHLLENINRELLGEKSAGIYDEIADITFNKASSIVYNEGYKYYSTSKYSEAISCFQKSILYKSDQYFSDDAMYYMAISYMKLGNNEEAKATLNKFKEVYPDSKLIPSVEKIIEQIGN